MEVRLFPVTLCGTWDLPLTNALSLGLSDQNYETTENIPFDVLLYLHHFVPLTSLTSNDLEIPAHPQNFSKSVHNERKIPEESLLGSASQGNSLAWNIKKGH